jgi:hypothetical protein
MNRQSDWKMRCLFVIAFHILSFPGLSHAQVPTYINILTFTSPVRLVPTNTSLSGQGGGSATMGSQQAYRPSIQVSSIGSARYLILALNGQTDGLDIQKEIFNSRNYDGITLKYTLETQTNFYTNFFIPSGGVFVFPMNPVTKNLTSQTPVFKFTNSSGWNSVSGVWNVTNGFRLAYSTSTWRTNTNIWTMVGPVISRESVTPDSYMVTNKLIFLDRYVPKSVTVYTTNGGVAWNTNSIPGSGNPGYVADN